MAFVEAVGPRGQRAQLHDRALKRVWARKGWRALTEDELAEERQRAQQELETFVPQEQPAPKQDQPSSSKKTKKSNSKNDDEESQ